MEEALSPGKAGNCVAFGAAIDSLECCRTAKFRHLPLAQLGSPRNNPVAVDSKKKAKMKLLLMRNMKELKAAEDFNNPPGSAPETHQRICGISRY
jgi:hypothetical protein